MVPEGPREIGRYGSPRRDVGSCEDLGYPQCQILDPPTRTPDRPVLDDLLHMGVLHLQQRVTGSELLLWPLTTVVGGVGTGDGVFDALKRYLITPY